MSLNGDVMVMRNGRSTSQISVYNYPEHLNPFYEDDQHKRLRFWHLSKKGNGEEGRRNSFSMSGLKDIWAFKSFRLSKKKSSTLGINKTSESPPPLRRDVEYHYGTYDPRMRHSAQDSAGQSANNFQRGAYRSSLQNMNSSAQSRDASSLAFARNNEYRSTIQVAGRNGSAQGRSVSASNTPQPRRYVAMTPQPVRNNYNSVHANGRLNFNGDSGSMSRGPSQSSVNTNPFDSDYEDERDATTINDVASTGGKRTPRKKRRAPAVPVHQSNASSNDEAPANESTSQPGIERQERQQTTTTITTVNDESTKKQNGTPELRIEETLDISNLTAEIENFVKSSNESDDVTLVRPEAKITNGSGTTTTTSHHHHPPQPAPRQDRGAEPGHTSSEIANRTVTVVTKKTANGSLPQEINRNSTTHHQSTTKTTATSTLTTNTRNGQADYSDDEPIPTLIFERRTPIGGAQAPGTVECIHVHMPKTNQEASAATLPVPVTTFRPKEEHEQHEGQLAKTPFVLAHAPKTATPPTPAAAAAPVKQPNEAELKIVEDDSSSSTSLVEVSSASLPATLSAFSLPTPPSTPSTPHATSNDGSQSPAIGGGGGGKPAIAAKPTHLVTAEVHKPSRRSLAQSPTAGTRASPSPPPASGLKIEENITITITEKNVAEKPAKVEDPQRVLLESPPKAEQDQQQQIALANSSIAVHGEREATPMVVEHTQQVEKLLTKRTTTATVNDIARSSSQRPPSPPPRSLTASQERLRIIESTDSLAAAASGDDDGWLRRPKPRSQFDWKQSTLAPLNKTVPPEKRKSVKDIIESINRSQRLLQQSAHKEATHQTLLPSIGPSSSSTPSSQPPTYAQAQERFWSSDGGSLHDAQLHHDGLGGGRFDVGAASTPLLARKFSEPNNNFDENRDAPVKSPRRSHAAANGGVGGDMSAGTVAVASTSAAAAASVAASEQRARPVSDPDPLKLDNSEDVFQKCRVVKEVYDYREASPTASNLDWNPVPKPKRTKTPPEP